MIAARISRDSGVEFGVVTIINADEVLKYEQAS
jgi:hypothetical protein